MFDLMPFGANERNIWSYLDNLEKSFFGNTLPRATVQFRTDVADEGDRYVLSAELPGFNKEDIKIDIDKGYLTISAQHNEETEEKKDSYIRRERRTGSFARSFDVSTVNTDAICAKYENGILTLELPKLEATPLPPARQIDIQ